MRNRRLELGLRPSHPAAERQATTGHRQQRIHKKRLQRNAEYAEHRRLEVGLRSSHPAAERAHDRSRSPSPTNGFAYFVSQKDTDTF